MSIIVGFAGSMRGMTEPQREAFRKVISDIASVVPFTEWRVGGYVGADEEATEDVCRLTRAEVASFPNEAGDVSKLSAKIQAVAARTFPIATDWMRPNLGVVDGAYMLIVAPRSNDERRGTTLATFRAAVDRGLAIAVVSPDGQVERLPCRKNLLPHLLPQPGRTRVTKRKSVAKR